MIRRIGKELWLMLPPVLWIAFAVFSVVVLFRTVDLKPKVESHFFFSEEDPHYQEDLRIKETFAEPEQIVLSATGPIQSPEYQKKIRQLTIDLLGLPPIFAAQSLVLGPKNIDDAYESPLWRRILISKDGKSSLLILFMWKIPGEEIYKQIEQIASFVEDQDFKTVISGAPYVIDLIRRNLVDDLQTFTVAAFFIFACVMLSIFRSLRILIGMMISCMIASVLTLFIASMIEIQMGPLTANLATIVFVLTLSHIAYMTFNWKHLVDESPSEGSHPAFEAAKVTIAPSFWSMFTTFLGFVTLIFVEAAPLKRLGVSGALGTWVAFLTAFIVYPWFLRWKTPPKGAVIKAKGESNFLSKYFSKRHPVLCTFIFLSVILAALGLPKIDNDPSLLSYFQKGSDLRNGLDLMDRDWGSSSLKFVISDQKGRKFNTKESHKDLWELQQMLEKYPPIGNVISIALILEGARDAVPVSFLLKSEWILKQLEKPTYGEIAKQFVTDDRKKSLLIVRMKSSVRTESRFEIIETIKNMIRTKGFETEMIGGLYLLQGKIAQLVTSSLLIGLGILMVLFIVIGLLISRSFRVTMAMFFSLVMIPVWLLGLVGHLKIPMDMISGPATNLAIAMGVDAMIHLLIMVRRCHRYERNVWDAWVEARRRIWKPILSSAAIVCAGFSIFVLSHFPPTQRFGLGVISGSLVAPVVTLIVLPTLAGAAFGRIKAKKKAVQEEELLDPSEFIRSEADQSQEPK